jgi:WD40 repeat protein
MIVQGKKLPAGKASEQVFTHISHYDRGILPQQGDSILAYSFVLPLASTGKDIMRPFATKKSSLIFSLLHASLVILLLLPAKPVQAQYFGRNKPHYRDFDFKVYQTPHFDIYHYTRNDSLLHSIAQQSEQWYARHQEVLKDTIKFQNPVILYETHADFQQTTAISGEIGVGTGGVTEAFKNRVVMPVMESRSQTAHVLGHELVHAFQYNILRNTDSVSLYSDNNIPLWMIEGLAEYMSIGRIDPHTAMWMRDAVLHDRVPTLEKMTYDPTFFPYRYGQAFWAFVGAKYGDQVIKPLFIETAKRGVEGGMKRVLGLTDDSLSVIWRDEMKKYYEPYMAAASKDAIGTRLLYEKNAGEMNMSPSLSPDGKYIAFYSEKSLLSIDLFLADAATGKVIRKLSDDRQGAHVDALAFIESAGTWSPDSRQFAYVVFEEGKNLLYIANAKSGKTIRKVEIPGVPSFSNPAWSPDGNSIVVSGLVSGQSDLFLYDLRNKTVRRLTNDVYSDIQASWSPDGKHIVFATDRVAGTAMKVKYPFGLAVLDVSDNSIITINVFKGADNLNPSFANDSTIYFLSDRDGFRNLYSYSLDTKELNQLTDFFTGISGLTDLSSAVSIARSTDRVAYSFYNKGRYEIFQASHADFKTVKVDPDSLNFGAALLPPYSGPGSNIVEPNIYDTQKYSMLPQDSFSTVPYKPCFKLDFVSGSGAGIAVSRYGAGVGGGVSLLFSDILGNNQLFTGVSINGRLIDAAGMVAYVNQKKRINFGGMISHIPYRASTEALLPEKIVYEGDTVDAINYQLDLLRALEDQVSLFAAYPLSSTRRLEAGGGFTYYNYVLERYRNYYVNGYLVDEDRDKLPAPKDFHFFQVNAAYVIDNSFFGIASPMRGQRARYQYEQYIDGINIYTTLIDHRFYKYIKPVALAYRVMHYARYGSDAESNKLSPLFVGYPTLVRGYDAYSFYRHQDIDSTNLSIDQLIGTRMIISNFEIRLPFTGPKRLTLIPSKIFYTELNGFLDGGIAWTRNSKLAMVPEAGASPQMKRIPVFSAGASIRINLFGMLVLEPYYAFPFQRKGLEHGVFGLNFAPGW